MKKSKKLISLLLALVMLLSIIPMAVAAGDAAFTLGQTSCNDAVLTKGNAPAGAQQNKNLSEGSVSKNIGEMGLYKRLPRVTTANADYLPVEYIVTDDAVSVSNPDVIGELEFSLQPGVVSGWPGTYPCIEFGYKALKAGTTNVSLKFFYKFDSGSGLTGWYYDLVTFTVNVSATEVQKPSKPTVDDVKRFHNYVNSTSSSKGAVYMWCGTYDHQAWFDYITEVDDAYTLGDVVANDGSVLSKYTYPWVCVMTLDANKYLDAYNYEFDDRWGTHYLKDGQAATEIAIWYWNASLAKWQFRSSDAPIYIDITHTAPTPEVTEYTVTYTDGVENEEVFADQVYTVKEGDPTPEFVGEPTRKGYKFLGWEPTVATTVTGNAVYTATWELETYTITYDLRKVVKSSDVRNMNNPTTFTVEDLPLTLNAPSFKNNEWPQKFLNWRDADGNVLTQITEPGDITLYAYYQFPVRYRVYDEDGKEVEDLTVVDWYNEDEFASYKVRPATVDMPGYEIDGWYQTTKDFGKENKRFGSLYMAKKYELVGKLSCCINVTVMVDGEIQATQKFTGPKGTEANYFQLQADALTKLIEEGKTLKGLRTYVDGKEDGRPVFGSCANVVIFIYTKGTITVSGDDFIWDDSEGNTGKITVTGDDFVWDN